MSFRVSVYAVQIGTRPSSSGDESNYTRKGTQTSLPILEGRSGE